MKQLKLKGLTSLTLACTFVVVAVSGTALYFTPRGRVANWTGWTLGGLSKHQWEAVHLNACLFLLVIVGFHLFYNWRIFWTYIRTHTAGFNLKLEMATAIVITSLVVVGTIAQVPPFTQLTNWGEQIKGYWDRTATRGPSPHAEEMPLGRFARTLGLWPEDVVAALQQDGLQVEDPRTTVAQLAEQNHTTPAIIYAKLTKHFPQATEQAAQQAGKQNARGGGGRGQGGAGRGQSADHDQNEFGFGGGRGPGWGRGQGQARGMGMGMGFGGFGQGRGRGAGKMEHETGPGVGHDSERGGGRRYEQHGKNGKQPSQSARAEDAPPKKATSDETKK